METAKDILEKHRATDPNFKFRSMTDNHLVLAAMREIADKAFDAGEQFVSDMEFGRHATDKSTFMKSLFPLKEI